MLECNSFGWDAGWWKHRKLEALKADMIVKDYAIAQLRVEIDRLNERVTRLQTFLEVREAKAGELLRNS